MSGLRRSVISAVAFGLALAIGASSARAGVPTDYVARWALDDGGGMVADEEIGAVQGTLTDMDPGADWVGGQLGGALDFDGINDYVDTNLVASDVGIGGANLRTITLWAYVRAFDGGGLVCMGSMDFAGLFGFYASTTDYRFVLEVYDGGYGATVPGSLNTWVHFAIMYDGTKIRIFANGSEIGIGADKSLNTTDVATICIGRYKTTDYFDGIIDDVRVYDRALTAAEILAFYDEKRRVSIEHADAISCETDSDSDTAGFIISRNVNDPIDLVVNLTASGTADGADFALDAPGAFPDYTVTIPSGSTSVTVTLTPVNDAVDEEVEYVTLDVAVSADYFVGLESRRTASIIDYDSTCSGGLYGRYYDGRNFATDPVVFDRIDAQINFDTLSFNLAPGITGDLGVVWTGRFRPALSGTYTFWASINDHMTLYLDGDLVFDLGYSTSEQEVTYDLVGGRTYDLVLEFKESDISGGTRARLRWECLANGISKDYIPIEYLFPQAAPLVNLITKTAAASEKDASPAVFTLTRPTTLGNTLVNVELDVTSVATAGDFVSVPATVVIPSGSTSCDFSLTPIGDALVEGDEDVVVNLLAGANYTVGGSSQALATVEDGTVVEIEIAATAPFAYEDGSQDGEFTITRSDASYSVDFNLVVTGTAAAGTNYTAFATTINMPAAGSATLTVPVQAISDAAATGFLTVEVTLEPVSMCYAGANDTATVRIVDEDGATVWVEATDDWAREEASLPYDTGTFTFYKDGGPATDVTVTFSVHATSTAEEGASMDFLLDAPTHTVVIPGASPSVTVIVTPENDDVSETAETVVLWIDSVDAGSFIDAEKRFATVTIWDDDGMFVSVEATDAMAVEAAAPVDLGEFTVSRTGDISSEVEVFFSVGGTAVAGTDFVALPASVTIPPLELAATVAVTPLDNATQTLDLTVVLSLITSMDYELGAQTSATVLIRDNDNVVGLFQLSSPSTGSALEANEDQVFSWDAATGATNYIFQYSTDSAFATDVTSIDTPWTGYTLSRNALTNGETYYWRVIAESDPHQRLCQVPWDFSVVDNIAPQIRTITPADGDEDVTVSTEVKVVFSEPMDPTTTKNAISMEDAAAAGVPGSASLSPTRLVLTFEPTDGLAEGVTYTVRVAISAEDLAGYTLAAEETFSFTTELPLVGLVTGEGCGVGAAGACSAWVLLALAAAARRKRK